MTSRNDKTSPATERDPTPLRSTADPGSIQDRSAQWALSLLAEAEPYEEVPGRRERVWLGLRSGSRRPRRWRWVFAAVALTASAAFASAGIAGWPPWLARLTGGTSSLPPTATKPVATPTTDRAQPPAPLPAPETPRPSVPATAVVAPVGNPAPQPTHVRRAANVNANANANAPEETAPLLEAMRALRIEQNPARARQLLTDYLGQHPRGFLAEEALVMLVEAAAAHHDSDAAALVARYHRLYPEGAFRSQVERISSAYEKKP